MSKQNTNTSQDQADSSDHESQRTSEDEGSDRESESQSGVLQTEGRMDSDPGMQDDPDILQIDKAISQLREWLQTKVKLRTELELQDEDNLTYDERQKLFQARAAKGISSIVARRVREKEIASIKKMEDQLIAQIREKELQKSAVRLRKTQERIIKLQAQEKLGQKQVGEEFTAPRAELKPTQSTTLPQAERVEEASTEQESTDGDKLWTSAMPPNSSKTSWEDYSDDTDSSEIGEYADTPKIIAYVAGTRAHADDATMLWNQYEKDDTDTDWVAPVIRTKKTRSYRRTMARIRKRREEIDRVNLTYQGIQIQAGKRKDHHVIAWRRMKRERRRIAALEAKAVEVAQETETSVTLPVRTIVYSSFAEAKYIKRMLRKVRIRTKQVEYAQTTNFRYIQPYTTRSNHNKRWTV